MRFARLAASYPNTQPYLRQRAQRRKVTVHHELGKTAPEESRQGRRRYYQGFGLHVPVAPASAPVISRAVNAYEKSALSFAIFVAWWLDFPGSPDGSGENPLNREKFFLIP
jgi:hypothetical protein